MTDFQAPNVPASSPIVDRMIRAAQSEIQDVTNLTTFAQASAATAAMLHELADAAQRLLRSPAEPAFIRDLLRSLARAAECGDRKAANR